MASDFTVKVTPVPDKKKVIEGLLLVYRTAIENKLARGEIVNPGLVEGLFQGKAQGNGLTGRVGEGDIGTLRRLAAEKEAAKVKEVSEKE